MGGVSSYYKRLQEWQNTTRRYRDLSIAATVIVYALTLVDAYVDAQLFDYDISPDLSLQVTPTVIAPSSSYEQDSSVGLSCKLKF